MSRPTATLRLRGVAGPVEAQVHIPQNSSSRRLVVAFVDPAIGAELCSALGAIVVVIDPTADADMPLLEWLAAHAGEFGASADAIAVAGLGDSARRAEQLVAAAALAGWPPLELLDLRSPT